MVLFNVDAVLASGVIILAWVDYSLFVDGHFRIMVLYFIFSVHELFLRVFAYYS